MASTELKLSDRQQKASHSSKRLEALDCARRRPCFLPSFTSYLAPRPSSRVPMYFSSFQTLALCAFALQSRLSSAENSEKAPPVPCTVHSPNTGLYYDLRPISLQMPGLDKRSSKSAKTDSWQSKGYDFHANFTINICAPVVEDVKDVVGLERQQWQNVSAFYTKDGKTYSIG